MSKQYANLHTMAKTSVKFQNDWPIQLQAMHHATPLQCIKQVT